jgi:hypothetical protein
MATGPARSPSNRAMTSVQPGCFVAVVPNIVDASKRIDWTCALLRVRMEKPLRLVLSVVMWFALAPGIALAKVRLVAPAVSPADEEIPIVVRGLTPGTTAILGLQTRDAAGNRWRSTATCIADVSGVVDLARCDPIAGTYRLADRMELFWSMRQVDGPAVMFHFPPLPEVDYELSLAIGGREVKRVILRRQLYASKALRRVSRADSIVGTLFEPLRGPPRPAVVLVGGSGGGQPLEAEAAQLAMHGFTTLSLAYYNQPGLTRELLDIPVETVERAVAWLRSLPTVDADRIAIVGHSGGCELALLAASLIPEVKAVVARAALSSGPASIRRT